jgi:hypothetical protein
MSHLINKLLGREDESTTQANAAAAAAAACEGETCSTSTSGGAKHSHKHDSKTVNTNAGGHTVEGRTVQHEGVNIKSTISSDASSTVSMANQQKLNDLVSKLGSTHSQIDEYAKSQSAKINDEIQGEINQVLARTRQEQDQLLSKANEHTAQIDTEYRARLQKMVEEIDAAKAKRIADIENDLNKQQANILQVARAEIDQLNQKAANLKIGVLQQAQAKASADATAITAEASHLGQASTVHQSTGTTTIKTEVSAAATTKESGATATTKEVHGSTSGAKETSSTKTVETSRNQSNDSRK